MHINCNNTGNHSNNCSSNSWEVDEEQYVLFKILLPFVIAGILGNCISIHVWTQGEKCQKSPCSRFFVLLAISDILVLLVPIFESVKRLLVDVEGINYIVCKGSEFIRVYFVQASAWFNVTLAIERMMGVVSPVRWNKSGAKQRAIYAAATIWVSGAVCNLHVILLTNNDKQCTIKTEHEVLYYIITLVSYVLFTAFVPFGIIISCNIAMAITLARRKRRHFPHADISITKLVVISGLVFMLSTLPWSFLVIRDSFVVLSDSLSSHSPDEQPYSEVSDTLQYVWLIAEVMYYLNNVCNVILHCLYGHAFRHDLKKMLYSLAHTVGGKRCKKNFTDITGARSPLHSPQSSVSPVSWSFSVSE